MDFESLFKTQKVVVKLLDNSIKKKRVVHTYLFEGVKGTLKLEAAYYLASLLLCEGEKKPCYECLSCRRIREENHPRITVIAPSGESIKKEQVLSLEHDFGLTSLEEGKRVFIIKDIDKTTNEAANSLLKFLEEGGTNNYGILLTDNINNCLPTIKSRAQIISFVITPKEELIKELLNKGIDKDISHILVNLTNNASEAVKWIEEGKIIDYIELAKKIELGICSIGYHPLVVMARDGKELINEKSKDYHQMFLDLLLLFAYDKIYYYLNQTDKIIFNDMIDKLKMKQEINYSNTVEEIEKILECKKRLKFNINLELMYSKLLLEITR